MQGPRPSVLHTFLSFLNCHRLWLKWHLLHLSSLLHSVDSAVTWGLACLVNQAGGSPGPVSDRPGAGTHPRHWSRSEVLGKVWLEIGQARSYHPQSPGCPSLLQRLPLLSAPSPHLQLWPSHPPPPASAMLKEFPVHTWC
jgi:hypothetical protein